MNKKVISIILAISIIGGVLSENVQAKELQNNTIEQIKNTKIKVKDESELPIRKDGNELEWSKVSDNEYKTTYISVNGMKITAYKHISVIKNGKVVREAYDEEAVDLTITNQKSDVEVKIGDKKVVNGIEYTVTNVSSKSLSETKFIKDTIKRDIDVNNYELYSTVSQKLDAPNYFHFNGYNSNKLDVDYWTEVIKQNKDKLIPLTDDYKKASWGNFLICDKNNDGQQDKDTSAGGVNSYGVRIKTIDETKEKEVGASDELITKGLPIYYYLGHDKIIINELAGELIAPYANVEIIGQNSGCIIAKSVKFNNGEAHRNISGKELVHYTKNATTKTSYIWSGEHKTTIHHDAEYEDVNDIQFEYEEEKIEKPVIPDKSTTSTEKEKTVAHKLQPKTSDKPKEELKENNKIEIVKKEEVKNIKEVKKIENANVKKINTVNGCSKNLLPKTGGVGDTTEVSLGILSIISGLVLLIKSRK